MHQWVKLHTEVVNDPRLGRLGWAARGVWVMLLALAGKLEHRDADGSLTGRLDTLENVAWYLRTSVVEIRPALEALTRAGLLLINEDGILYLTDFAERQAPDSDAERMRRYRATQACGERAASPLRARYASVTPALRARYASVTPALRDVAESESESESEQESDQQSEQESDQQAEQEQIRTDVLSAAVDYCDDAVDADKNSVPVVDKHVTGVDKPVGVIEKGELAGTGSNWVDRDAVKQALRQVAAARDLNRACSWAQTRLETLGVDGAGAISRARDRPSEGVMGWQACVRQRAEPADSAGFAASQPAHGLSPPAQVAVQTWYTQEEYERFFYHGASTTEDAEDDAEADDAAEWAYG